MPGTVLIIAVVLLAFAAMAALALRLLDAPNPTVDRGAWNAYEACDSLLTEGERSFFGVPVRSEAGSNLLVVDTGNDHGEPVPMAATAWRWGKCTRLEPDLPGLPGLSGCAGHRFFPARKTR